MPRKAKPQLVCDEHSQAISRVSVDEQAQHLDLGDAALHNGKPDEKPIAGNRAHQEHEQLKQELTDTLEEVSTRSARLAKEMRHKIVGSLKGVSIQQIGWRHQ